MANLSEVEDHLTARTDPQAAVNRAVNLSALGVQTVLELCVGPSLKVLESAYKKCRIVCFGNDIERRWQFYYHQGHWIIGDSLKVRWEFGAVNGSPFKPDCVVFAPPLSKGCTGRREDALRLDEVSPGYREFLQRWASEGPQYAVLVLPSRSLSTKQDREQFYSLMGLVYSMAEVLEIYENCVGRRQIRKYVEVYLKRR